MKNSAEICSGKKDCGCSFCSNNKSRGSKLIIAIVVLALLALAGFAGYTYYQKGNTSAPGKQDDTKEIASLVKKIGRLIVLPTGEQPVLATVKDAASLKAQQPFFAGAENGDKLLIYTEARKAFLYSEKTGKLINVGPVMNDDSAPTAEPVTKTTPEEKKK